MNILTCYIKGVTRLNNAIGRSVALLVFLMFLLITIEVGFRYFLNSPTVWTNELTQMLFGLYGILSGGYILAQREHVNVDLLHSALPVRARAVLDVLTSLVFFIFTLALLWFGYEMARDSMATWETSHSAWNPPVWPIKLAIPIGAVLLILQGIAKLLEDIAIAFNLSYYTHEDRLNEGEQQ